MTEQQLEILDQLIENGYATRTVGIMDNTIQATFHTLTAEQQMAVEAQMKDVIGTPLHGLHTYTIKLLSQALVKFSYKGKETEFTSAEEAEKFIRSRPTTLVDNLVAEQSKLEKETNELISGKTTVEDFSKIPSTGSVPS